MKRKRTAAAALTLLLPLNLLQILTLAFDSSDQLHVRYVTIESDRSLATCISTVFSSSNLLRIKKPPHNVSARGAKLRFYCNDLQGCTGRYKEQLPHCRTSLRKT